MSGPWPLQEKVLRASGFETRFVEPIASSFTCPHNGWLNGYSFQGEGAANDCADNSMVRNREFTKKLLYLDKTCTQN